jgi:hypothetical protein
MISVSWTLGVSHHPGVTKRLFSVASLSRMLKNIPTVLWSFFELKLKTDVQQSYPAVKVTSLKLFEIPISQASRYAVARRGCLCWVKHAIQSV